MITLTAVPSKSQCLIPGNCRAIKNGPLGESMWSWRAGDPLVQMMKPTQMQAFLVNGRPACCFFWCACLGHMGAAEDRETATVHGDDSTPLSSLINTVLIVVILHRGSRMYDLSTQASVFLICAQEDTAQKFRVPQQGRHLALREWTERRSCFKCPIVSF